MFAAVGLAALDDESVLGERGERLALDRSVGERVAGRRFAVEQVRDVARDTISCASVKVFIRNTSSRSARGHER